MALPTLRNVGAPASGTGATLAVVMPTCSAGDMLLLFAAKSVAGGPNTAWSTPAGWTALLDSVSTSFARLQVFTKIAIGGDSGATVTLTSNGASSGSGATTIRAVAVAYQNTLGVHASTISGTNTGSTTTLAAPTVTTTRACLIVDAWAANSPNSSSETITAPATSRVAVNAATGASNSPMIAVADQTQSSSGTTTAASATVSSIATSNWSAATIALYANTAPNAPTLNGPIGSATVDRTITQRFSWTFSDPDPGDTQSAFDLRYSSDSGATWTTVSGTTPNNYVDIASGTLAAGSYQWQVRTYDALGVVGPYSASAFFTAATPPTAPTITYPTSGGTVQQSDHVTWSVPSQNDYQVRRVADVSGNPDTTTIYSDTGDIVSTSRTQALTFPTNSRYEHIQVRAAVNGLWSTWTDVRVQVSYTPPPTPTLTVTPSTTAATITVTIANPTPTGSQPALDHNDLYRSKNGGTASIRVATGLTSGATWVDRTPASGTAYSYQAVAVAGNATTAASAWTS